MKRERIGLKTNAGLCFAFLILSACAKDKTTDEYHQQKAEQQAALYQSISASYQQNNTFQGSYIGKLVNQNDGSSMGTIQIELWPEVTAVSTSDNTGMANQTVLKGKVTLTNKSVSEGMIGKAAYTSSDSSTTGHYEGSIPIIRGDGSNGTLSISGDIVSANTFQGQIYSSDHSGISATFNAVKTAGTNSNVSAPPIKEGSSLGDASTYVGQFKTTTGARDADNVGVRMVFKDNTKFEEKLFEQFIFLKKSTITLNFNLGDSILPSVVFKDAQIDTQNGRITAQTTYSGEVTTTVSLDCAKLKNDPKSNSWQCTYLSSLNGNAFTFQVAPQSSSDSKGN